MNKIGGLDEFMADKTTIIASSLKDDEVWSVPPGYRIKEDSNVHKLQRFNIFLVTNEWLNMNNDFIRLLALVRSRHFQKYNDITKT